MYAFSHASRRSHQARTCVRARLTYDLLATSPLLIDHIRGVEQWRPWRLLKSESGWNEYGAAAALPTVLGRSSEHSPVGLRVVAQRVDLEVVPDLHVRLELCAITATGRHFASGSRQTYSASIPVRIVWQPAVVPTCSSKKWMTDSRSVRR